MLFSDRERVSILSDSLSCDRDPEHVPTFVRISVRLGYDGGLSSFKTDMEVQVSVLILYVPCIGYAPPTTPTLFTLPDPHGLTTGEIQGGICDGCPSRRRIWLAQGRA